MDKSIKTFIVLTIVLLNPILSSVDANAGYDKFFYQERKQENQGLEKLIPDQPKKEPKTEYRVIRESVRQITAYNVGDIYQTDSTPCTGAYSKVNLCEELEKGVRVCAANFVPLNTVLRISSGEQSFECIVWDRMHERFPSRVDIAMSLSEKSQAKQFGLQKMKVQILEKADDNESI